VPVGSSGVSEADRQGRIKGQYSFYESMVRKGVVVRDCPVLTAPTSESDTKVRSMIVWQALVMNVGTLPLLHKNRFEFRIKSKRDSPLGVMGVGVTAYYQTFLELFAFLCQSSDQRIWGVFLFKAKVGR